MSLQFANAEFTDVYFMESMDGDGLFQANLHVYAVKAEPKNYEITRV